MTSTSCARTVAILAGLLALTVVGIFLVFGILEAIGP